LANVKRAAAVPAIPRNSPEKRADSSLTGLRRGRKPKPFDYSRYRVAFRDADVFAGWLAGYPDLSAVICYFYRLLPKIDLSRVGLRDNYIFKSANPGEWTPDFVARRWGRGHFLLKVNDANAPAGQQERARVWFIVDDPDLLPVYDPRALMLGDPENADEIARLLACGVLVRDAETGAVRVKVEAVPVVPGSAAGAAGVAVPAPVVASPFLDQAMGNQVIMKLLDRALPSATPQTASDVLEQSFQIADRFNNGARGGSQSIEQIVEAVVLRLRPVPAVALSTELETFERVSTLLEKVGAGRALDTAAVAGSVPGWAAVLLPFLESAIKPLVPVIVGYFARPAAVPAGPAAGGVLLSMPPPRPVASAASAVGSAAPPAYPVFLPLDAPLMDRVVQVAGLALAKQAEGVTGFAFASWMTAFYPGGKELYEFLEARGGRIGAMGLLQMVPSLASQLDEARKLALEAWFDDLFTFDASIYEAVEGEAVEGEAGGGAAAA
jgi:hypothetical protein